MQQKQVVLALIAAFVAVASAQYLAGYAAYPSAYSTYGAAYPAYSVAAPGVVGAPIAGYPYSAAYLYKK